MKTTNEIDGWFNYSRTFDFLLSKVADSGVFVECGAWLGKSSSYLCDKAQDRISVYIVDSWLGSENELTTNHKLVKTNNVYEMFLDNMGDRKFTPIVGYGLDAALLFDDSSCDVVFIDMEHTYNAVKKDIEAWLPKVKVGGYLAGHDYESQWQGVVDAVNEVLGQKNILTMDTCWIYKKENK